MKFSIYLLAVLSAGCVKSQSGLGSKVSSNIVIITNGDSNSQGVGNNAAATTAEKGVQSNVKILNNNSLVLESLNIGVNNDIGGGVLDSLNSNGVELGFANAVDSGKLPSPLYIGKVGHSGYKITNLLPGTPWWDVFTARMDILVSQLTVNEVPPKFFMFYSEGINDSNYSDDPVTWKNNTVTYIQAIRSRYGRVPIFMVYVPLGGLYPVNAQAYNLLIDKMAQELPEFYPINTDGAPISVIHWTYSGYKQIAYRMVQTILSKYTL